MMNLDRRQLLKGLMAGAVAISVSFDSLNSLVEACEKHDIEFYRIKPSLFELYEETLPPQARFQNTKLSDEGIENLMFKGRPLVPYVGETHRDIESQIIRYIKARKKADGLIAKVHRKMM